MLLYLSSRNYVFLCRERTYSNYKLIFTCFDPDILLSWSSFGDLNDPHIAIFVTFSDRNGRDEWVLLGKLINISVELKLSSKVRHVRHARQVTHVRHVRHISQIIQVSQAKNTCTTSETRERTETRRTSETGETRETRETREKERQDRQVSHLHYCMYWQATNIIIWLL
jgi:hypothetical protein